MLYWLNFAKSSPICTKYAPFVYKIRRTWKAWTEGYAEDFMSLLSLRFIVWYMLGTIEGPVG